MYPSNIQTYIQQTYQSIFFALIHIPNNQYRKKTEGGERPIVQK
jgi:hypothetical protein